MLSPLKSAIKQTRDTLLEVLPLRTALQLEFYLYHRRLPNLDHPVTFNEKIQHRKLFDRDPRLPLLSDKITAKEFVADKLGPEWVVPTIWHGSSLPPREQRNWQKPYVLKASHGSGWNIFVRTPVEENWPQIEQAAQRWLSMRYGRPSREWAYLQMQPKLLVEPYLDSVANNPNDYKLFVFDGKVIYIQVDTDRYLNHKQYFYDPQWNRQNFEYAAPGTPEGVAQPQSLAQMIRAAEVLAAGFSFTRVDLYEIQGKPMFGEMTFYPNAARSGFNPKSADTLLGSFWPV